MKFFTKKESIGVLCILLIVSAISGFGFTASLRRSRDAQRMADLSSVADALSSFHEEYGFFPPTENGKIKACKAFNFPEVIAQLTELGAFDTTIFLSGLRPCEWGIDGLSDLTDESRQPYIKVLPKDPSQSYLYLSTPSHFQLYAHIESEDAKEGYDAGVVKRNLMCGALVCSYGRSYANTPLDKSLEEYENELQREVEINRKQNEK